MTQEQIPQSILEVASQQTRQVQNSFSRFLENIPAGQAPVVLIKFFHKIQHDPLYVKEFFEKLYSLNSIRTITPEMYSSGLGELIFELSSPGLGKGEIFVAWCVKNAYIQGGTSDYDIRVGENKFELKNYRGTPDENGDINNYDKASIRLGVKGKIIKFDFWFEILETVRRINKIQQSELLTQPLLKYFDSMELKEAIQYIQHREERILDGEFCDKDFEAFQKLCTNLNNIQYSDEGYTHIILRGPNVKPHTIAIEDIPLWVLEKYGFALKNSTSDFLSQKKYIMTEFRRIKYVREPEQLQVDIDEDVKRIIGDIPFVIFREDGITVTKNLVYSRITQGSIQLIEKTLKKS